MTFQANPQLGTSLGVGELVSDSFSILMRNFLSVVLLALIPTIFSLVASGLAIGWGTALGINEPVFTSGIDGIYFLLSSVAQIVGYGVTTALLVQLAYDTKLERPVQLGRYVGPALGAAVPIAILTILSSFLMIFGMVLLIVPGLWIYAVFSVMPAAVVIEKIGFGGLGRSQRLTKDYRWPILGTVILIGIINSIFTFAAVFIVGLMIAAMGASFVSIAVGVLAYAAISSIGLGLGAISIALIYARLREIKEGASVRDIAAVFE